MSDTTPQAIPADALATAERKGFYKGQVMATRAIVEFFRSTTKEMIGPEFLKEYLANSRASYDAQAANGEDVGVWNDEAEQNVAEERRGVISAYLEMLAQSIQQGTHLDASMRHPIRDKHGVEWSVSKGEVAAGAGTAAGIAPKPAALPSGG